MTMHALSSPMGDHASPDRQTSRFVEAGGLRWHVQRLGSGPLVLLVHGTGSSTHSWRAVAELLAPHFEVIALDLPGHAFTSSPAASSGYSLTGMTKGIALVLSALGVAPELAIGHSAGAAILAHMCLDRSIAPRRVIAVNPALLPLHGLRGRFFSPAAKLFAGNDVVPRWFAWRAADRAVVERLLASIGSHLDSAGIDAYARLARSPRHVAAALRMMANWDLMALERELPKLADTLVLVAGANDRAISPSVSRRIGACVPAAPLLWLPNVGHLAPEESPSEVAAIAIRAYSNRV